MQIAYCAVLYGVGLYFPFHYVEDERLIVAERDIFGAKVLRLNISEIYQCLHAQSLLKELVKKGLILPQTKKEAESYTSKYAQNIIAGVGLLSMYSPPKFLQGLFDTLEAVDAPEQKKLTMKLKSGIFYNYSV